MKAKDFKKIISNVPDDVELDFGLGQIGNKFFNNHAKISFNQLKMVHSGINPNGNINIIMFDIDDNRLERLYEAYRERAAQNE